MVATFAGKRSFKKIKTNIHSQLNGQTLDFCCGPARQIYHHYSEHMKNDKTVLNFSPKTFWLIS